VGVYFESYKNTLEDHYCRYTFNTSNEESGSKITFQIKEGDMSSLGCANPGIGNNFSHDDFIKALNNGSIKLYCAITIANNSNTPPSSATELKLKYRGYSITNSSGEPSYIYETDITEISCEIYSN
jgi:hypothetical protein